MAVGACALGWVGGEDGEAAQVEGKALELQLDGVGAEREVAHLPVAIAALERAERALDSSAGHADESIAAALPAGQLGNWAI